MYHRYSTCTIYRMYPSFRIAAPTKKDSASRFGETDYTPLITRITCGKEGQGIRDVVFLKRPEKLNGTPAAKSAIRLAIRLGNEL